MIERPTTRRRLPETRQSLTHKFRVADSKFYITVGLYPDGSPGEIFMRSGGKVGSFEHGMLDGWSIFFSLALQSGIPLAVICEKFKHTRFEPSGITENSDPSLRFAASVLDYVARWMEQKFLAKKGVDDVTAIQESAGNSSIDPEQVLPREH